MKRGDLATLAAGIIFVVILAFVFKGGSIFPLQNPPPAPVTVPATTAVSITPAIAATSPPAPQPHLPPVRITYARNPFNYPNIRIPAYMETFGGSDIPWKDPGIVKFAEMEGSRGGLSQEFTVPYPLWGMNITVESWTKPQYARFGLVLCSAEDGSVLEGVEILNRGTAFRSVQVSGKPMYLIISTDEVDRFRIDWIAPMAYYNTTGRTIAVEQ